MKTFEIGLNLSQVRVRIECDKLTIDGNMLHFFQEMSDGALRPGCRLATSMNHPIGNVLAMRLLEGELVREL